ncbi:UNVERIFIED_CONTAM: hypothetical protein FKN15_029453 [Acipenser sinensis]
MPEGSDVYSGGEGPRCRNDSYITLKLQAVLVKAMPSQGHMKQHESLYEYRLMSSLGFKAGTHKAKAEIEARSHKAKLRPRPGIF